MKTRLQIHEILCSILGSRNVYFQAPETMKMSYPAIVYKLNDIENTFANDSVYSSNKQYLVTVIDRDPDTDIVNRIAKLPMSQFNRYYVSDNLNHYVFTLFF